LAGCFRKPVEAARLIDTAMQFCKTGNTA
jgi:hypothetical protein